MYQRYYDMIQEGICLSKVPSIFATKGIISQITYPCTPQQNRVAKRKNCHLLDVVWSLLIASPIHPLFGMKPFQLPFISLIDFYPPHLSTNLLTFIFMNNIPLHSSSYLWLSVCPSSTTKT